MHCIYIYGTSTNVATNQPLVYMCLALKAGYDVWVTQQPAGADTSEAAYGTASPYLIVVTLTSLFGQTDYFMNHRYQALGPAASRRLFRYSKGTSRMNIPLQKGDFTYTDRDKKNFYYLNVRYLREMQLALASLEFCRGAQKLFLDLDRDQRNQIQIGVDAASRIKDSEERTSTIYICMTVDGHGKLRFLAIGMDMDVVICVFEAQYFALLPKDLRLITWRVRTVGYKAPFVVDDHCVGILVNDEDRETEAQPELLERLEQRGSFRKHLETSYM